MHQKRLLIVVVGIGMTAVLLLLAGLRTPAALAAAKSAGNWQVFTGTVLTSAGSPATGAQVNIYVRSDKPGRATLLGTAVTSTAGQWSLRAPAYASLPKAAKAAAAANMGYLNVEVIAVSGSSVAIAVESAWVGTAANSAETGSIKPMAMSMRLASPSSSPSVNPACCSPRDGCAVSELGVLGHSHSYTIVGEYHAYWNASGGLSYTRGAASSIGSYGSVSGGPWTFSGYDTFSTSNSLTMGFPSNGQYDSHQMVVSLDYEKTAWVQQNADTGATCKRWDQIDENGIYNPGHGWLVFKKGASVIKHDGLANYRSALKNHPSHVNRVSAGGSFSISRGSALTYGVAANAFGISIQATTSHSTQVAQAYSAGSSKSRFHYVWGNDGSYTNNPQVVYSY